LIVCFHFFQESEGFCLSVAFDMLMKPLGFQIEEIELEEIAKFNSRLQTTGRFYLETIHVLNRGNPRWSAMQPSKDYLVQVGVHILGSVILHTREDLLKTSRCLN
jgi:predicted SprT family Zn-dependent metalloprotease